MIKPIGKSIKQKFEQKSNMDKVDPIKMLSAYSSSSSDSSDSEKQ